MPSIGPPKGGVILEDPQVVRGCFADSRVVVPTDNMSMRAGVARLGSIPHSNNFYTLNPSP